MRHSDKHLLRKAIGLRDPDKEPTFNQQLSAVAWLKLTERYPSLKGRVRIKTDFRSRRLVFEARRRGKASPLTACATLKLSVGPQDKCYPEALDRAAEALYSITTGHTTATAVRWDSNMEPAQYD